MSRFVMTKEPACEYRLIQSEDVQKEMEIYERSADADFLDSQQ
jgi:hypothetical protein